MAASMHAFARSARLAAPRALWRGAASAAKQPSAWDTPAAKVAKFAFFGGLVGGTFCLGCWQSQRYFWKVDLLEQRRLALAAAPLPLPAGATAATLADDAPELDERCRRVTLRGTLDPARTAVVGPRSAPPGVGTQATGLGTSPQGHLVFTVLTRPDGSEVVVNRGWAPRGADPAATCPRGSVDLVAVVDGGETPGKFSPVNTAKDILWVELPFLRSHLRCGGDALLVNACPADGTASAYPKPRTPDHLVTAAVMPQTHAAYAATWYALSAAGAVMTCYV